MLNSMLQHLREARAEELEGEGAGEAGFTLIELMVVLLIIAILLAIAIPTFLGVTSSANDRAAQSNLSNAVTEGSAVYQSNNQTFPAAASVYQSSAPEFTWTTGSVSAANNISVDASTDSQAVIYGVYSPTNTCWYVLYTPNESSPPFGASPGTPVAVANAGTYYAKHTIAAGGSCSASTAAGYTTATDWAGSYGTAPSD
jgi:type IV pilus assembly protein PilA